MVTTAGRDTGTHSPENMETDNMGWDYSPKPSHVSRIEHLDAELRRVMRGTLVRRTGIIRDGGQHVWSLHIDTDGTPYGVCTLHEQGAYKYVSTTMGPGHDDPPVWLTDVLASVGPENSYERDWLIRCGALEREEVPA